MSLHSHSALTSAQWGGVGGLLGGRPVLDRCVGVGWMQDRVGGWGACRVDPGSMTMGGGCIEWIQDPGSLGGEGGGGRGKCRVDP